MDLEDQPEQRWQDVLPQIQHTFEDAKPWWCAGKLECREYSGKVYFWANFDTCACGETQTSMVILGKKTAVPLKDRMDAAVRKVLAKVLLVLSRCSAVSRVTLTCPRALWSHRCPTAARSSTITNGKASVATRSPRHQISRSCWGEPVTFVLSVRILMAVPVFLFVILIFIALAVFILNLILLTVPLILFIR